MGAELQQLQQIQEEMGHAWEEMKRKIDVLPEDAIGKEELEKVNTAITELRDEQQELVTQMKRTKAVNDGKERWNNADQDPLTRKTVASLEKSGLSSDDAQAAVTNYRSAFVKYVRHGVDAKNHQTPEEAKAVDQVRALSDANDNLGGFIAPAGFESGIIMGAYELAAIRPRADVQNTSSSAVMVAKMAKPSFAWGQASVQISETTLKAGLERIDINDLRGLYLIANNTLDDADADVIGELTGAFSLGIAEEEDNAFSTGDGVQKPLGIFSDTGVRANYTASGVAAALSDASNPLYDTLVDTMQNVKTTYRMNATWAMNSVVEGEARKMKDDNGLPIWAMPVAADRPATLLGKSIINPEGAPAVAANAFPIAFGDFRFFRVRDRQGMTVQRLVERYADYDQTGFLVKKRVGAQVVQAEAFRLVKVATS